MRYARSSYNDEELDGYATDCRELLKDGITSGRVFYLRGIVVTNSHLTASDEVIIYDDDTEGAEDTGPDAADRRFSIYCGPMNTVVLGFEAPGIKFTVGVLAALQLDTGTFATHSISIFGYEE